VTFDRYSGRRKPERSDLFRAAWINRGADNREAAKNAKADAKKKKTERQERQGAKPPRDFLFQVCGGGNGKASRTTADTETTKKKSNARPIALNLAGWSL
jgi:hypothetical protein